MAKTKEKVNGKEKTTAMVKWEARLAEMSAEATKIVKDVGSSGNFLSMRGGVLSYQGATMPDNKMRCIILYSVLENQHYDKPYDANNPTSPDCYAFGTDRDDMVPHEAVTEPYNETCAGCPNKAFATANVGKGKACGDVERMALITENDLDNIEEAEIAFVKVPYFSTIEYAQYVRLLESNFKRPPLAFITELTVVPDPKSQFRLKFKMLEEIEGDATFEALWNRFEKVKTEIVFPYPKIDVAAPVQTKVAPQKIQRGAPPARATANPMPPPAKATTRAVGAAAAAGKTVVGARRPVKQPRY